MQPLADDVIVNYLAQPAVGLCFKQPVQREIGEVGKSYISGREECEWRFIAQLCLKRRAFEQPYERRKPASHDCSVDDV